MNLRMRFVPFLLFLVLFAAWMPSSASAYSYGNPNEEAVAENYKLVVGKLNLDPPDYPGALQAFGPIKEELDMHMGKEPSAAIEKALNDKNKAGVIAAYQKTLVLNVARRLAGIEKDFANYENGKLLLAKGLATYEALSPQVKGTDEAADGKIRQDFEAALESLGNPGLFGVGVKPANKDAFLARKTDILSTLQTKFQLESLEVGHFETGAETADPNAGKQQASGDEAGTAAWKNWLPLVVIVLVLGLIVFRTLRKRRG